MLVAKYDLKITGIDILPGLITTAQRLADEQQLDIVYKVMHGADLSGHTNSPREKNRLNSVVIGRKLSDRYNDSAIDEPLKSESKGGETPDTDKIA